MSNAHFKKVLLKLSGGEWLDLVEKKIPGSVEAIFGSVEANNKVSETTG